MSADIFSKHSPFYGNIDPDSRKLSEPCKVSLCTSTSCSLPVVEGFHLKLNNHIPYVLYRFKDNEPLQTVTIPNHYNDIHDGT